MQWSRQTLMRAVVGVSVMIVAAATLLTTRVVSADGNLNYLGPLVVAAGIACYLVVPAGKRSAVHGWHRSVWPLFALIGVDAFVRLVGAAQSVYQLNRLGMDTGGAYVWLVLNLVPLLAMVAAMQVGMVAGKLGRAYVAAAYGAALGGALIVAGAQYLASVGVPTIVNDWVVAWNATPAAAARLWTPAAGEGFRATALEFDPNFLGAFGLAALVWALAAKDRPAIRGVLAVASTAVIWLSASRTAMVGVILAAGAVGAFELMAYVRRCRVESRPVEARWVVATLGVVGLPAAVLLTGVGGGRLGWSAKALSGGGRLQSVVSEALGGRVERWAVGWDAWLQKPLGWFAPPDIVAGVSIHNEFLSRLVWGGPLMLAGLLFALGWLVFRFRPAGAPAYGIAAGLAWLATAAMLDATLMAGFTDLMFFGVGAALTMPPYESPEIRGATAEKSGSA